MKKQNLSDFIQDYCLDKFPDHRISGTNIMIRCLFCGTHKRKLGIDFEKGIYHCFVCDENGNFIKLYSILENMTYDQANVNLAMKCALEFDLKPASYRSLIQDYTVQEEIDKFVPVSLDSYKSDNEIVRLGWMYLYKRKLFDLKNQDNNIFYVALEGRFRDRLILPYSYRQKILYFQGRSLKPDVKPKYLNPGSDHGVRSADILYPFELSEEYVLVCEGSVDARSLQLQGLNATCTTGCYMSEVQCDALKQWGGKIIMSYDNDSAGKKGIHKADNLRKLKLMPPLYACHPPEKYKDWNDAHIANVDLNTYVNENTYLIDELSYLEIK